MRIENPNLDNFLRLYPNILTCSLQTFDDNKERKDSSLAKIMPFEKWARQELTRLNNLWAGIFFSVNSMQRGRRDAVSVTWVNAWIVEIDDKDKETQLLEYKMCALPPSCIIESKVSYHAYWFCKDASVSKWKNICKWLAKRFWWDPKVIDIARVLRLPWFNHSKKEEDKFFVSCMYIDPDLIYTEKQMQEEFPFREESIDDVKERVSIANPDNIWDFLWWLDNKEMLSTISGGFLINWDIIEFKKNGNWSEQIFVNWTASSCWLDRDWYIGSSDKGWPTWIQWIMWYWKVTKSELLKWSIDHLKDKIPMKFYEVEKQNIDNKKQEVKEEVDTNFRHITVDEKLASAYMELMDTDPSKVIKWWWKEWDDYLWGIYPGKIYLIGADTWGWKSTFVNAVCSSIARQWHRVVKYSLEDRMNDIGKQELYYMCNRLRKKAWKDAYRWTHFNNNEYWTKWRDLYDPKFEDWILEAYDILTKNNIIELEKSKQVNIDELCQLITEQAEEGSRFFAIDHLHYFEMEEWENKMATYITNVMHRLNEVCRTKNITIFLVAHYKEFSNTDNVKYPLTRWFKNGSSIKQVANIIIQIVSDYETWETEFFLTKIRWPYKRETIVGKFDLERFEYDFTPTPLQKSKSFY